MAPSIAVLPETTSELIKAGVTHTIAETVPSLKVTNGHHVPQLAEMDASKLIFTQNPNPKIVPEPYSQEVVEQSSCTDHMITCKWTASAGWEAPHLEPYGPLSIMPTASVLHYATECFEGMKVYRGYDLKLRLFRPDCNARRMLVSASRISLPGFNPQEMEKLIMQLVSVDGEKWLPKSRPGHFLYLRPTMIATSSNLGVQKPKEALFYVLACLFPSLDEPEKYAQALDATPAAPAKPGMRLLASKDDMVRAWPGGFGYAKVGANYGPSLIAQAEARALGYSQILWLYGKDCEITEAGASNFFVVWQTREGKLQLVTAPLYDKIILDGVTRRSILEIARQRLPEIECVERKFNMKEVEDAVREGRMVEAFAAGTAFFVSPVSHIHFRGKDLEIPLALGASRRYTTILKTLLRNIMYGKEQHPWGVVVEETGTAT